MFAPYFSSSSKVVDLFVRNSNSYFEWRDLEPGKIRPGYGGFQMPHLRTFLNMGQSILNQGRKGPAAPLFILSSESDIAVGNRDHHTLFQSALAYQPYCWYHRFDRVLDVPHTMMIKAEGNAQENLLNTMAKAYIESSLTWSEVEEIGFRMTQGRTFNDVVAELRLGHKASPDMPAMMTMVDKRSIAIARSARNSRGDRR